MAYQIQYDNSTNKYEITKTYPFRFPLFLLVGYLVFFAVTHTFWPEGKAFIQELIIPGDNDVTIEAFHTMTDELRAGASFDDAIHTFCLEIINGTKVPN